MSKHENTPTFSQLIANPIHFLAFGFGSGLSPVAPGTAGTVVALPLFALMSLCSLPIYLAILTVVCVVGVYLCGKTAQDLGVHDHGGIVWDEFAGLFITLLPIGVLANLPAINTCQFWLIALYGFALFRLFDAVKPWPISWFDKNIHGGLGIMLDDVIAGIASLVVLQATLLFVLGA